MRQTKHILMRREGGGTYSTCYVISTPINNITCTTGYTTLVSLNSTKGWVFNSSVPTTNDGTFYVTIGGSMLTVRPTANVSYTTCQTYDPATNSWTCTGSGVNCVSYPASMQLLINTQTYVQNILAQPSGQSVCAFLPSSVSLCCK